MFLPYKTASSKQFNAHIALNFTLHVKLSQVVLPLSQRKWSFRSPLSYNFRNCDNTLKGFHLITILRIIQTVLPIKVNKG